MAIDEAGRQVQVGRSATIYTIGAYGSDADSFIGLLEQHQVDALVDVRMRRGMRGAEYAWANSQRLQQRLAAEGIGYVHAKHLAPTPDLRAVQHAVDRDLKNAKRMRTGLSSEFSEAYFRAILQPLDPTQTAEWLAGIGRAPALFCVERVPEACHRSLIAEWLGREGIVSSVVHIAS